MRECESLLFIAEKEWCMLVEVDCERRELVLCGIFWCGFWCCVAVVELVARKKRSGRF